MQNNHIKLANDAVNYLMSNDNEIWNKLIDHKKVISDPELEKSLKVIYKRIFPTITPSELNTLISDVESVARTEMLLREQSDVSRLIVETTRRIKSEQNDLWHALIIRDINQEDELSPENAALFRKWLSGVPNGVQISEIIFGIRTIVHSVSLNLIDPERI